MIPPPYEQEWHHKPKNVILLLFSLFPLGLYYMWKNKMWTVGTRWLITIGFLYFLYDDFGEDIEEGIKNWPPEKTEISAREANAFVDDLAVDRGQGILDSYEYSYGEKFRLFVYFTGNISTNSACFFVVRNNKLALFKHSCGEFEEQQNAFNDFVEGLQ